MATVDPITTGITSIIAGNSGITTLLNTYSGSPAVFNGLVPEKANYPYVIVPGATGNDPWDTKTELGSDVLVDVFVYGTNLTEVEDVANRIHKLLHKTTSLTITGYSVSLVMANGPVIVPTSEKVYGRMVTVTIKMQKV